MSEHEEKLTIAESKPAGGPARCRLDQLRGRWGRAHCKLKPSAGDRIYFEPMADPEIWRVTGVDENGVALEQESLMTYLQLIRGGGSAEHPCSFCGEVWNGPDDTKHGAHVRGAQCGHVGTFNCQLKMIEGFCSCPPSGPAYPRQPHEPRYEMDTAGNLRKVMVEPAPPPLTPPVSPTPVPELHAEPVDHREEVGGFKRGEPCAFQHRFQADGTCAVCRTRVPDGCTCAPSGTEKIGYTHAPSCKLEKARPEDVQQVLLLGAPEITEALRSEIGAVVQVLEQHGVPLEALTGDPPETPPWVGLTEDGSELACQRCGALEAVPLDLDALSAALATFEGAHRTCPEKRG